jgi:hypothetical protein
MTVSPKLREKKHFSNAERCLAVKTSQCKHAARLVFLNRSDRGPSSAFVEWRQHGPARSAGSGV